MTQKILLALGMSAAFVMSAAAQTTSAPSSSSGQTPNQSQGSQSQGSQSQGSQSQANQSQGSATNQSAAGIQQHLTEGLEKAGFSNVQIMPESFLVRAKDKDGRAVMMVINPDSVTSVTSVGAPAGSNGQNGQGTTSNDGSPKKQ